MEPSVPLIKILKVPLYQEFQYIESKFIIVYNNVFQIKIPLYQGFTYVPLYRGSVKLNFTVYSIVVKMTLDSENPISNQKNKGGRPLGTIWEDINQGQSVTLGKFSASCKYCEKAWNRGEVSKLEEHLSNHCKGASANVVRKYMTKVLERQDKSTKKESS